MTDALLRPQMRELTLALRAFHAALLAKAKEDYEFLHGPVGNPYELFNLVTQAPSFQWLRPLSGLMATLDEVLDAKNTVLTQQNVDDVRRALRELFEAEGAPFADFQKGYEAAKGREDVQAADARWRKALAALPDAGAAHAEA